MPRTKEEIIARMNEVGYINRFCGNKCTRASGAKGDVSQIDVQNRTIPFILISKDNAGERYDWWTDEIYIEELDVNGARLDELYTFFKDHNKSVDTAAGRVENKRIEDGEVKADVTFGSDKDSYLVFQKYNDRILTDVSIGYIVHDVTITEKKGEPTHVLVTDFTIVELSAVWKGFDKGATIGRSAGTVQPQEAETPSLRNTEILRRRLNLKQREITC
ncbi:peptidase [Sulfurimonas sp. HSL-1716]|uniref:peptidase n=1 Tax=Hydrocurvibacter sulfurireducens TaxID=3131937 RepID=UPI0031F76D8F